MRAATRHRAILLLVLILTGVGLVLLAVSAVVNRPDPLDARPFDRATWAAADSYDRAPMAKDAIRHLPAGLPEAEVVALLGKPGEVIETHRLTTSRPRGAVQTYSYFLGSWSYEYFDSTFLWVHVDAAGRIVEAVIGGG